MICKSLWPFRAIGCRGSRQQACPLWACAVTRRHLPVGASPTRQPLQPKAIGAVTEVTRWLKPSIIDCGRSLEAARRHGIGGRKLFYVSRGGTRVACQQSAAGTTKFVITKPKRPRYAFGLPDPIPVHREPIYSPCTELVAKYPTRPDAKPFGLRDIGNVRRVSHHSVAVHPGTTRYVRLLDLVRPKNVENHFARGEKIV